MAEASELSGRDHQVDSGRRGADGKFDSNKFSTDTTQDYAPATTPPRTADSLRHSQPPVRDLSRARLSGL